MTWKKLEYKDLAIEEVYKKDTSYYRSEEVIPHQERLKKAFDLALKVSNEGYNVYVCGPRGIGRTRYTLKRIQEMAPTLPTPPDICYVNNFEDPARPKCLLLPAGYGKKLEEGLEGVLDFLKRETFKAFEGKEY
ncbi:MAG: Lon-like protease helical domain-containing protein, partial [Caldimicrobium sp.]